MGDEKRVVVQGGFEEEGMELEEVSEGFGSVDEGNGALRYPQSHLLHIPTLHHFQHCTAAMAKISF